MENKNCYSTSFPGKDCLPKGEERVGQMELQYGPLPLEEIPARGGIGGQQLSLFKALHVCYILLSSF